MWEKSHKTENWYNSSSLSYTVSLEATFSISSVKVSVNKICFCTRWSSIHIVSIFVSLKFWCVWNARYYVYVWCFFLLTLIFSRATTCISRSIHKFSIFQSFKRETLTLISISLNLIFWQIFNLHMLVSFLEIPTHLSPKLPTVLLPRNCQWTISSVFKVTRWTDSELFSLLLYSHRLKLAKERFCLCFRYSHTYFLYECLLSVLYQDPRRLF